MWNYTAGHLPDQPTYRLSGLGMNRIKPTSNSQQASRALQNA